MKLLCTISTVSFFCSLLSAWNVAGMPRGEAAILQPGGRSILRMEEKKSTKEPVVLGDFLEQLHLFWTAYSQAFYFIEEKLNSLCG